MFRNFVLFGVALERRFCRPAVVIGLVGLAVTAGAAPAGEKGAVVATGKGVTLSGDELRAELRSAPPDALGRMFDDPLRVSTLVRALLKLDVLGRQAETEGLLVDPILQQRIKRARQQLVAEALRERKLAEIAAAEPDFTALAQETYRANPADYQSPEQVQARHILLKVEPGAAAAAARAKLDALAERARNGEDFAALAREASEDQGSAENGGDLGYFGRGRMVPPFEAAAFALTDPGQLSPVVETQFGLHLIQLVERKPGSTKPFAEVREQIIAKLRAEHRRASLATWEQDLIEAAAIEVDTDAVRAIVEEMRAQPPTPGP